MKKNIATIVMTFFLLATFDSKAQEKSNQEPQKKILLVGDSLAQGLAAPMLESSKKSKAKLSINCTHSTRTDYWSPKIESIINSIRPDVVIVSLGTNDSGISNTESQRIHIKKIVATAKKYKAKILWLLPPKLPKKFRGKDGIRKIIFEELKPEEVYNSDDDNLERTKDEVHMTGNGYKSWVSRIWKKLVSDGVIKN